MHSVADAVFALPFKPRTALVARGLEGWSEALTSMGVRVLDDLTVAVDAPDLVVAPSTDLDRVLRLAPHCLIVQGRRAGWRIKGGGYAMHCFLPLPDVEDPRILLPLSSRRQIRYALDRSPPRSARKRLRNRVVIPLLGAGLSPPGRSLLTVGSREPGAPFFIAEACSRFALPPKVEWLLLPGAGDALSRGTFHMFPPGQEKPGWVVKFARVPGYSESFDRDERGLALATAAGPEVIAHAPRLLGRFTLGGIHASVESAAVGQPLLGYLASSASLQAKRAMIDRIAGWQVAMATVTATNPECLAGERRRIKTDVLPHWTDSGLSPAIVDRVSSVSGVLQHNDLGTWNVIVDPRGPGPPSFIALDWESARAVGMPLWDLFYFLQDALGCLDGYSGLGEGDLARREGHAVRLFRGELPSSRILFEWTRRAVASCGIPEKAVGTLAMLCFLHHGLSQRHRERTAKRHGSHGPIREMLWPRLARRWLEDPALGPGWDRWR